MSQMNFLKIEGVKGECHLPEHKEEIEILNWNWSITNASSATPTSGARQGKITVSAINFSHYVDLASPALMRLCFNAALISKAILSIRKDPNSRSEYLKLTFEKAIITSVALSATDDCQHTIETFAMEFAKVTEEYTRIKPDGSVEDRIATSYDIKAGKAN